MTRRRKNSRRPGVIFYALISITGFVVGAGFFHIIGWLVLLALSSGASFLAGRASHAAGPGEPAKVRLNRLYGKFALNQMYPLKPVRHSPAYRGGSYPPESGPIFETDINSAYPSGWRPQSDYTALRKLATQALAAQGWPKSEASMVVIDAAIANVLASGQEPDIRNVLPRILRAHGESKSRRVNP